MYKCNCRFQILDFQNLYFFAIFFRSLEPWTSIHFLCKKKTKTKKRLLVVQGSVWFSSCRSSRCLDSSKYFVRPLKVLENLHFCYKPYNSYPLLHNLLFIIFGDGNNHHTEAENSIKIFGNSHHGENHYSRQNFCCYTQFILHKKLYCKLATMYIYSYFSRKRENAVYMICFYMIMWPILASGTQLASALKYYSLNVTKFALLPLLSPKHPVAHYEIYTHLKVR